MSGADDPSVIDLDELRGLLLDQVSTAVIATDLDGRVVLWNRKAEELYGWAEHEAIGRPVAELAFGPADVDAAERIMSTVRAGHAWAGEFEVTRKDGSSFVAQVTNAMLHDASGEPIGIVGMSSDISALRAAEARAHHHGELAGAVLDALPTPAVVLDGAGIVVMFNRACAELDTITGSPSVWVGATVEDVAESAARFGTPVGTLAAGIHSVLGSGDGAWRGEYSVMVDDVERWFSCEVTAVKPDGCVVTFRDITSTVDEREALRRMATERHRLVTLVSHEVRTPLTAILGLAEELTVSNDLPSDQIAEFHAIIAEQAREVSAIIDDLLVAARIDNDTLTITPKHVDVASLVRSVVRPFQLTGADIVVSVPEPPVMALADDVRLRQVIRNLVSNAFRHGAPPVGAELVAGERSVTITVFDHGRGIPFDRVDQVFRPFGSRPTAGSPDSLGIGLSVARALVERMGGVLSYGRNGRTEFSMSLPT